MEFDTGTGATARANIVIRINVAKHQSPPADESSESMRQMSAADAESEMKAPSLMMTVLHEGVGHGLQYLSVVDKRPWYLGGTSAFKPVDGATLPPTTQGAKTHTALGMRKLFPEPEYHEEIMGKEGLEKHVQDELNGEGK